MAVAAYDSDLTSANSGLVDEALTAGNWDESSVAAWADGGTETAEGNFYIQGTDCISAQFTKTGVGTLLNDVNQFAGAFTVDTDGAILIWAFWASPASLTTYATGGIRTVVGNTVGDFYAYKGSGSDFEPNPFGGWYCYAVDPNTATADTTVGTPDDTWSIAGIAINATAQSRGNPFAVDAVRVGRCTLEVTNGQAGDYGTFVGMASFDTSTDERYGLFQTVPGGYRWQGLMSLGLAGTAVDFRDSNANIVVANTPMVAANFNKIEIHNTSSNVEWSSITINSYGVNDLIATTTSAGNFEVVDNATVAFDACTFIDMNTFIFNDGTNSNDITDSTFQRCGLITTGAATFTGCKFDDSSNATSVVVASPADATKITNSEFVSGGTGNGLEITGTATNITLTGLDFTGYSASVDADKAIYVNIASGSVELNISGGSGVTVASDVRTAGATVTVVSGAVTVAAKATLKDGTAVVTARVYLKASDGTGPFPFEETVTIARTTITATVTHATHGMATNDKIVLAGITDKVEDNGIHTITKIDAGSYSFTTTDSGSTSYTGTIKSTFVALNGTTDGSGNLSTSRVYASAQPVTGWTRKSSGSPYLQEGILVGEVSASTGFSGVAVMLSDE